MSEDRLSQARAALDAADFTGARRLLSTADAPPSPDLLELRARAAYGAGHLDETLSWYSELYRLHLAAERFDDAAQAAVMVGMYLMMDTGLMATVRAWLGRAERLVARDAGHPVWAWLAAVRTYERFMSGDMPGAERWARRAIDDGRDHGLEPPVVIGRVALARVRIHDGDIELGLSELDDVAIELSTGALDPLTSGQMWCEVICAMQWVGHYDRAEQWTAAMEVWRHGRAFGGINGRCRVHRAEIKRLRGPCDEAEQEALRACEELRPWMRREFGWPLTELGNARLRKGDLEGAEEAFLAAHQNAWSPQPGLALVRLAQGRTDEALAMIAHALDHPFDIPSKERPPSGGLRRAPLLDAAIPIALAARQPDRARASASELQVIADTYRSRTLANCALAARGRLAAYDGDAPSAIRDLTAAVAEWVALHMPFEAAHLRLELARAHRDVGDSGAAELELSSACRALRDLGAEAWADIASTAPATPGGDGAAPASRCTFARDGDVRRITFEGKSTCLRDLKGMRYLARLLAEPGRAFHVLDLVAVENRSWLAGPEAATPEVPPPQAGLEVFDRQARDAYEARLAEVEEDLAEAETNHDLERAALARADRDFLMDELRRGLGLGRRSRKVGGDVERARTSATRSLRYALSRIAEHHPELARHLDRTVETGTYFVYAPDPRAPVDWST